MIENPNSFGIVTKITVTSYGGSSTPQPNLVPSVSGTVSLPGINNDTSSTFTSAQLLQYASDADGDALSVINVTADSGTLVDNGNNTWTLTPAANFEGTVTINYSVSDGQAQTAATATLLVAAPNVVLPLYSFTTSNVTVS